jgi:hypothetical protein
LEWGEIVTLLVDQYPWNPEREAELLSLWDNGKSASEIGIIFGATRNSIIGKVTRLRIKSGDHIPKPRGPQRWKPPTQIPDSSTKKRPSLPALAATKPTPVIAKPKAPRKPVSMVSKGTGKPCGIADLQGCKWAVLEDHSVVGKHLFCNAERPVDRPYCDTHAKLNVERHKLFTETDDAEIRKGWLLGTGVARLAFIIKRSQNSIAARAKRLGLEAMA